MQAPAQHQATADTRRDHHAQRVVVAARGALPVLGRGDRDTVADQLHRQAPGERAHPVHQREVAPARHVHRADGARRGVDRAGTADADRTRASPQGRHGEFAEHLGHGPHDRFAVLLGGRGALGPGQNPAAAVHQRAGDLGAADVQGRHEVGVHQSQISPFKLENQREAGRSSGGGAGRRQRWTVSRASDNVVQALCSTPHPHTSPRTAHHPPWTSRTRDRTDASCPRPPAAQTAFPRTGTATGRR